ncbi:MAG: SRPBCC family protein [Candidatus Eremiobacteraeota bacterium]|nr:SRPBCC family protein [Candidatus Eremiobacteraeota bacterium]
MIQTSNEIFIGASAEKIFSFAAATDRWPVILPHYRYVRVLAGDEHTRTLQMSAWRTMIPVQWTAQQWNDPQKPSIHFRHIAGWTKGMEVEWRFEPRRDGTLVTIIHNLEFQFPFAADTIGKHIVSDFFVHDIAGKTLARIKQLAEHA